MVIQPTKHLCMKVHQELMDALGGGQIRHPEVCRMGVIQTSLDEYPTDILDQHIEAFISEQNPEERHFIQFLDKAYPSLTKISD